MCRKVYTWRRDGIVQAILLLGEFLDSLFEIRDFGI